MLLSDCMQVSDCLCYSGIICKLLLLSVLFSDGASRSGLLAAALCMVDRMKMEQEVDVFLSSRFITVNRPHAIDSLVCDL